MKKYLNLILWIVLVIFLYSLKEGLIVNSYLDTSVEYIEKIVSIDALYTLAWTLLVIFFITTIIHKIFNKLSKNGVNKKSLSTNLIPVIHKVLIVLVWWFGLIAILSKLGFDVKALLAWAGIGGLALALAAQKTVANIFWAINAIINRPFQIGDHIKIAGNEWEVLDIGFTYLKLKNADGNIVLIPSETITSAIVENISKKSKAQ